MKVTSGTHWIGVFLLFTTAILLLIVTISAPIMNDVGLLRVTLTNRTEIRHSSVSFGTLGYCVLDVPPDNSDQDWCTSRHIGYDPADVMAIIDQTSFSEIAAGTSDSLTRVMVLHPVACGLSFVAFLTSLGAGVIGSLAGALVALVAWILILISLAVDFSLFGLVKHHVNRDGSGSHAYFGVAIWLLLASFVTLFFGMLIVFFTCCSAHREKKRAGAAATKNDAYPTADGPATNGRATRRKRFGVF